MYGEPSMLNYDSDVGRELEAEAEAEASYQCPVESLSKTFLQACRSTHSLGKKTK